MKNKNATITTSKSLRPAMLTEEELISMKPQFKNLTPEKGAKLIEFVNELSLILYNHYANSQNFKKAGEA